MQSRHNANTGQGTRAIQLYLGHKNIRHTVAQLPLRAGESRRVESGDIVDKLQELITIAWDILTRSIDANQYSAAMSGVRELARIFELIARLTGQLDEGTRVNVLVQQQRQRDAAQELMLDRLTVAERLELRRLVAKAQGELPAPTNAISVAANSDPGADGGRAHYSARVP